MPDATKHDIAKVKYKFLKLIAAKKGKLTIKDVSHFGNKLARVEFNKNRVNLHLASKVKI